jgi:plasmid stabilization system protein ParE
VNLVYSAGALEDIAEILEWWLDNRDKNPWLFGEELDAAEERLLEGPHRPPVFKKVDGWPIRRVLLEGTHHHVYYQFTDELVYVLAVWGAPKKGPPRLRPERLPGKRH